jgi:hypothetical protein
MFIAGWGKKGKEIAYFGIMKCEMCRNHADHRLYEYSQRVTVYFIPVAKFNVKYYLVCDICDTAREMDPEKKSELLQMTVHIASPSDFHRLWRELTEMHHQVIKDLVESRTDLGELYNQLESRFKERFGHNLPERQLDYIYARYVVFVTDDDLPN